MSSWFPKKVICMKCNRGKIKWSLDKRLEALITRIGKIRLKPDSRFCPFTVHLYSFCTPVESISIFDYDLNHEARNIVPVNRVHTLDSGPY